MWKDGLRYTRHGEVQRWLCRSCGYRFSDSEVEVNVIKQSLVLSDSVHNLGEFDVVNLGPGEKGLKDSALTLCKDVGSHKFSIVGKTINKFLCNSGECQVCVTEKDAKNLVATAQTQKRDAGATKSTKADIKGKIIATAWNMKKQGYAYTTVVTTTRTLKRLAKKCNLSDPEAVKETLARHDEWTSAYKRYLVNCYNKFVEL